tara:strand:+ start:626 stop:964 length:339 start_codon:yes stop_codon:yes gene_type:complete
MRKFLRLIEDNNPDAAAARYTFTLTMRNETGDVDETLVREIDDHSAAGDLWAAIGDIFNPPAEDQEGGPVEAMAAENPEARNLVQNRMNVEGGILQKYANETAQLKQLGAQM